MVAKALSLVDGRPIDFVVARSQDLPYADASFDVVTCITVLTFLPDADAAIREMARVLRPGGRLLIGDLNKWSLWAARRRIRGWLGSKMWQAAQFRTANDLAKIMAAAGLTISSVAGAIFFPPWAAMARVMAPFDRSLGAATSLGAAFFLVQADKP